MDYVVNDVQHRIGNCETAFFEDMPMIVTSSPIEGKRGQDSNSLIIDKKMLEGENPTWSDLLHKLSSNRAKHYNQTVRQNVVTDPPNSFYIESDSSSSYQPIAEHKMKILLSPSNKFQVISSGARKIPFRYQTPKKPSNSYSRLNHQYWKKYESQPSDDLDRKVERKETDDPKNYHPQDTTNREITVDLIKKKLKTKSSFTTEELESYEKVLKNLISTQTKREEEKFVDQRTITDNSDLMHLIEKQLGCCNLTPKTKRVLAKQTEEQEKRLLSLSVVKRKTASDIKKRINQQLIETKQQIKSREELELKLVRAAKLRQKATSTSTVFNQVHSAHHKRVVAESRQKDMMSNLQKQFKRETIKNDSQLNKIVQEVWKTFMEEQYNQLRDEVRKEQRTRIATIKDSESKLKRLKASYDEKLKQLKENAAIKAVEAGIEKKEISREIDRIQRNMQHQFHMEYNALLHKIELKGENKRFQREEKASRLLEKVKNADYVFDF